MAGSRSLTGGRDVGGLRGSFFLILSGQWMEERGLFL